MVLLCARTLLNSVENEHCRWVSTSDNVLSRPLDILSAGTRYTRPSADIFVACEQYECVATKV
jgi:hypothetical protein